MKFEPTTCERSFADLIEEFLAWQHGVRGLSPYSLRAYRSDLYALCIMLGASEKKGENSATSLTAEKAVCSVSTEDLRSCIGILSKQDKAASSINRFIASVRNFFAYCRRFGYIEIDPACTLKTIKNPVRVPKFMSAEEIDALCTLPERKSLLWPARDAALFEILYSSGCRVSELASLCLNDISPQYDSAVVRGKGGKDRRVFFSAQAVCALKLYLSERRQKLNELRPDSGDKGTAALFVNRRGENLSSRGIRFIVSRYSSAEGTNRHVSPHVFRHTFATAMIRAGADIRSVQEMLGHSSISTTQRYTHITSAELTALYNRAHPHGSKKE